MSQGTPTPGNGGPEWSHSNSNTSTSSLLQKLSQGGTVSTGPSVQSTGGPSTGTRYWSNKYNLAFGSSSSSSQSSQNTATTPTETTTPTGTTTLTELLSSKVMGIPVLWVALGVVGIVILIAIAGS